MFFALYKAQLRQKIEQLSEEILIFFFRKGSKAGVCVYTAYVFTSSLLYLHCNRRIQSSFCWVRSFQDICVMTFIAVKSKTSGRVEESGCFPLVAVESNTDKTTKTRQTSSCLSGLPLSYLLYEVENQLVWYLANCFWPRCPAGVWDVMCL